MKVITIDNIDKNGRKTLKENMFPEDFHSSPETSYFEEKKPESEYDDKIDPNEWDAADDSKDNFDYSQDYDSNVDDEPYSTENDSEDTAHKRQEVMKWLDSNQNKHSVLSYKLYPSISQDGARSKFSKKYRSEDKNGHKYAFSSDEINRLFNMKNSFIEKIQERMSMAEVFDILTESEIKNVIDKTIAKYL